VINEKTGDADIAAQKKKAKKLAEEQAAKLALEAETARKQKEKDEAEAARKQKEKEDAEAARKQKEKDDAEAARKQKEKDEADATARKQKEKEDAEAARRQKEKDDAEAARKQKEKDEAEAARKAKEKEAAARKESERQRKELEDRIKKMAKESEIKEQTDDLKKRILKNADVEVTAVDTASNLVTKISDKYAASIQAAIRPNITFDANTVAGNPAVEIQVGLTPDGAIVSITTVKSSGIDSWDTAAIRALKKTDRLPKDDNGRAPPTLVITLRPRER
jgi:colicin import membrane protein